MIARRGAGWGEGGEVLHAGRHEGRFRGLALLKQVPSNLPPKHTSGGDSSLGFAGTILVRSDDDLAFAKETGPLKMLSTVGVPWP